MGSRHRRLESVSSCPAVDRDSRGVRRLAVRGAVTKAVSGEHGVRSFIDFFHSKANVRALTVTLIMCTIVTALAIVLGAILAWALRATVPRIGRFLLLTAVLVPLWMGVVVKNYVPSVLLGPARESSTRRCSSYTSRAGRWTCSTPRPPSSSACFTRCCRTRYSPSSRMFVTIPLELPLAAESLGATRTRAMTSVVAPLAVPGLFATAVIVFVLSLGFYVTPVVLGGPRATFLATLIQNDIFLRFDPVGAATAGTLLVVIVTIVIAVATRLIGGERLRRAIA